VAILFALTAGVVGPVSAAVAPASSQAQQRAVVSGTVRDSRGIAQGGASVSLDGSTGSQTTRTDANGRFVFSVAPGVYSLSINKGGFAVLRSDDIVAAASTSNDATYTLATATTSTLSTIGGTSTTVARTPINRDITAHASIATDELLSNPTPNLNFLATNLPGVTLVQGNRSTLSYFNIRGSTGVEARTEIDGHPLSTGVSGVYYVGLLNPGIFESINVEKGPGVSAADAGESSFGTINFVTWDFSDKPDGFIKQGFSSYASQFTNILARGSVLPKKRLSYVVSYNVFGSNGPAFGTDGPLAAPSGNTMTPAYTVGTGTIGSALVDYSGPFNAGETLRSEVFKLRYRFSDATSVWFGYVGSQGTVTPEGDLYGYSYGLYKIAPCFNSTTPATSLSQCNQSSTYSNPSLSSYFGQTIPLYSAYPGETQTENNPLFEAELRTSFKNDTILIRPFTQVVQRINDGTQAPLTPGNNGAFSLATLPSQCLASNPCYLSNGGQLVSYTTASNPCAASNTPVANSCYQAGSPAPYYQYELDRLHGVTGTYLHPLGALGLLRASYQYTSDYTYNISGNTPTPAVPYQLAGYPPFTTSISDVSNISVPGAVRRSNDFSLTAFLTPSEKLSVAAGLFYNLDSLDFSYENPAILALAPYTPGGTSNLPYDLADATINKSHVDPHIGIVYNANSKFALRLSAGSSVTLPYAQQVSGLPTYSQPTATLPYGYYTEKNPGLTPETTVSYDLGFDQRLPDNGVFTFDIFDNVIHNAFLTEYTIFPGAVPAIKSTLNASNRAAYGVEFGMNKAKPVGFGYDAQATLLRAYYYDLGAPYYSANTGFLQTFDNRQPDGLPYMTAHAGLTYSAHHDLRAEFGANYEGNNNSYFIPGFVTYYASLHRELANHVELFLSGRNIFNRQDLAGIAKATLYGAGLSTVECKYAPSASNPQQYVQASCSDYTNGQQQIEPQTFSAALQLHL
jgi:outer membrane receptor protein involved in Fe transport